KELNYFTANYDRGRMWYERHFAEATPGQLCGECSPTYFFSGDAPLRAKAYNPDLKLIAVLRDPVARAFSNHLHEVRKTHIPADTSFEAGLAANDAYVAQSSYAANLGRWLESFEREALLVLIAEDIKVDPATAFDAICTHLGIDPTIRPDGLGERRHESVANKSEAAQRLLRSGGDLARSVGLGNTVQAVKKAPGLSQILAMNKRDLRQEVAPMRDETRAQLVEDFRADMKYVADLLGRDSLPWASWDTLNEMGQRDVC
ncbi:MAG: sulfotransferase domain-containing protein, partial [Pseudomonadota bacterium]